MWFANYIIAYLPLCYFERKAGGSNMSKPPVAFYMRLPFTLTALVIAFAKGFRRMK